MMSEGSSPVGSCATEQQGPSPRPVVGLQAAAEGGASGLANAAEEADEPESMADFLVKEVHRQQTPAPPAAATAARDGAPRSSAAPGRVSDTNNAIPDPRLACWHPTGPPSEVLAVVAERLSAMEGWRVTGEVVAVLEPSRRRESVVGERGRRVCSSLLAQATAIPCNWADSCPTRPPLPCRRAEAGGREGHRHLLPHPLRPPPAAHAGSLRDDAAPDEAGEMGAASHCSCGHGLRS
jgi:hypothetical protein